jgi:suppressor for copper-sensitivity B
MIKRLFFWFLISGLWCLASQDAPEVQLSLISESQTVGQEKKLLLGLHAQIAPGWKTYWRSPGVAGYGVRLTWDGSQNIKSARLLWPLPHHVQTQLGVINAYEGDVVLPISVEIEDPAKPVHANCTVDMLVCDDSNCLPVMRSLTLNLPVGFGKDSAEALKLRDALHKVPVAGNDSEIHIQKAEVIGADDAPPTIQVLLSRQNGDFSEGSLPDVFLEITDYFVDAPTASPSKDHRSILYSAAVYRDANRVPTVLPGLAGATVKVTIGMQNRGLEVETVLQPQSLSPAFFLSMLIVAFIGGLILNIMPCVLPVLSLKVLTLLRQGGRHQAHVRQEFMVTVLGIIFSFFVLALGGIALKASGHAIGWGIQFQEPAFVIGLITILTVFAANLFGFFEFRLPTFLSSVGGMTAHQGSLMGSFLEGSLVTLLATPCTAPFVGTALTFSLSRGSFEIISIFCAMGLGLAFPFLLIALFPSFAAKLPKPGNWMIRVKMGLGVLIMVTALWLLYVLMAGIRSSATLVGLMMGLILFILWRVRLSSERNKRMAWISISALMAMGLMLPSWVHVSKEDVHFHEGDLWHPFEPERIPEYVKAGKVVIVNVTANWCLTCQANKYFALKNKAVLEALRSKDVVAMEADWTNHDPKITAYLKSFHQYGIPFYAVYGCRNPTGAFLGQVLTPQKVLDALKREQCGRE